MKAENILFFIGGMATMALINKVNNTGLKNNPSVIIKPEIIKTVKNSDGTVTYYYANGGVVTETTNKNVKGLGIASNLI